MSCTVGWLGLQAIIIRCVGTQSVIHDVAELQEGGVAKIALETGSTLSEDVIRIGTGRTLHLVTHSSEEGTVETDPATESPSLHLHRKLHTSVKQETHDNKNHNCFDIFSGELRAQTRP